jgi:hypothetical protein
MYKRHKEMLELKKMRRFYGLFCDWVKLISDIKVTVEEGEIRMYGSGINSGFDRTEIHNGGKVMRWVGNIARIDKWEMNSEF